MFQKHIRDLNKDDIQRIVDTAIQEDAEVEFKEALPTKKGRENQWASGADKIDDYARDKILEEVVAFANTYGGTLVIGIRETSDKPARAHAISPIPRCIELADRLKIQCRDCIEPQIPIVNIVGVATDDEARSGVVVINLPQSRSGPHRLISKKECYKRHSDRTEKMTMREIQDLTLHLERGLSAIESRFTARAEEFSDSVDNFFTASQSGFGFRHTLIPLSSIYLDRVHDVGDVRPPMRNFTGQRGNHKIDLYSLPSSDLRWRPIIRGSRGTMVNDNLRVIIDIMCDGTIQYSYLHIPTDQNKIYVGWIVSAVCNSLLAAEMFRKAAGTPTIEYGLDMEIQCIGNDCLVGGYGRNDFGESPGRIPKGRHRFPRYSIGSTEEFQKLINIVEQDVWHAAGRDWGDGEEVFVDFSEALG